MTSLGNIRDADKIYNIYFSLVCREDLQISLFLRRMGREGTSSARRRESLCALSTKLLLAGKCKSIDDSSWSVERGMQQNGMIRGKDGKVLILAIQESIWYDGTGDDP